MCYEIYILLQTPTFPPDCCVRADNVTWQYWYTINMTGFIPRMIEQEEDTLYNVVRGIYEVVFTPIAKQLGLSGDSSSSIKGWLCSYCYSTWRNFHGRQVFLGSLTNENRTHENSSTMIIRVTRK